FRNYAPDGKTIFHAEIKIGNSILMLSDEIPSMQCLSPQSLGGSPVSMYVYVEDVDTMFNQAVSAGATIVMQLTDAFWGDRFCQLKDPFGHTWSLATRKQNLSPEELEKAAKAAFSEMAKQ
ncbi:MAG: VOC family protein, partial [Nitrososphaerales archaeon]